MERRTLIAAGAALVGVAGAGVYSMNSGDTVEPMAEAERMLSIPNEFGITEMTMGDPNAPIEMIEYASFTCPHCARFHADTFKQLKADFIDTGKVHFGYREVFFDRPGLWASLVARCGGPLRFFSIAEMIYSKQREWTASGDPATISEELVKIGKIAGLDQETLDACMSDGEFAQNLNSWYKSNAERDTITGTPSFLINGQKYANMAYSELQVTLNGMLES